MALVPNLRALRMPGIISTGRTRDEGEASPAEQPTNQEQEMNQIRLAALMTLAAVAACGYSTTEPTPEAPQATVFSATGNITAKVDEFRNPTPASLSVANAGGNDAFGFNGTASGFPTGAVTLTGGGAYDPATALNTIPSPTFANSAGGFRCTATVAQGPLAGCAAGEGVRWDTVQLLASTGFKCTSADAAKTAFTSDKTVVLRADFYRAGDGDHESFTAKMIVSEFDIAPGIPGEQNLWIEGVGCGSAIVHFN